MATINGFQEIKLEYKDGHTKNVTINGSDFGESQEIWEWNEAGELESCSLCFFATVDEVEVKLEFVAYQDYNANWDMDISVQDPNFISWESVDDGLGYDLDWIVSTPKK